MNRAYDYLSIVYDSLTDDINYEIWQEKIKDILTARQINALNVLEIGAGSGNMTEFLLQQQMRVTALEPSASMLALLQQKLVLQMGKLKFYQGDVFSFDTKNRYDMAFAFLDVINYIKPADLKAFFAKVRKLLNEDSYFLFDYSTAYKLREIIGNNVFAEEHEDFAFIWENYYDASSASLAFDFTLFTEVEDGYYIKQKEQHLQFAHSKDAILLAAKPHFDCVEMWGDDFGLLYADNHRKHILLKSK